MSYELTKLKERLQLYITRMEAYRNDYIEVGYFNLGDWAVRAYCNEDLHSVEDVKEFFENLLKTLVKSGYDFSIKSPDQSESPLEYVRTINPKLYEFLLNGSLDSEEPAFENKVTEVIKKIPGILAKGVSQVFSVPTRIGKAVSGGKKVQKMGQEISDNVEEIEKQSQGEYANMPDSQKLKVLIDKLPSTLNPSTKTELAHKFLKIKDPESTDQWKAIEKLEGTGNTEIPENVINLLFNPNFKELPRLLSKYGFRGIKPLNTAEAFSQLQVLAFYGYRGWDTKNLRVQGGNTWKSLNGMKAIVNRINKDEISYNRRPSADISEKDISTYVEKIVGGEIKSGMPKDAKQLADFLKNFGINVQSNQLDPYKLRNYRGGRILGKPELIEREQRRLTRK